MGNIREQVLYKIRYPLLLGMMGTTYGRFPKQKKLIEVLEGGTGYRSLHRGVLHPMCSLFFADWFEPEFPVDWDCIGRGVDCHFRDWLILIAASNNRLPIPFP